MSSQAPATSTGENIVRWLASRTKAVTSRDDHRLSERDRQLIDELKWGDRDQELPGGLTITWLGTAGFSIAYQGFTLLVDPYLTRSTLPEFLRQRPLRPAPRTIARHVDAADAILVGHTHFDHALDVPFLAQRHQCNAYGSKSLARLMALCGPRVLAVEVETGSDYEIGPFRVTFVPSVHSRLLWGLAIPVPGEIEATNRDQLTMRGYRCGQVYGIRIELDGYALYHQGSCDLIDDAVPGPVDLMLAGVAGRTFTRAYTRRILSRLRPSIVVPHHYDDFSRPLVRPLEIMRSATLCEFIDEVREVSREITIRTVDPLIPIGAQSQNLSPG